MEGDYMGDMMPLIGLLRQHASVFDDDDTSLLTWMKRSADSPPSSALNPPDVLGINSQNGQQNDDRPQFSNKVVESNAPFRFRRQQKQELPYPPQCMNQVYPTPSFDNSNPSWDWSVGIKNEHNPAQYKLPSRPACPPSGGSDWSTRESSASNSQPASSYGMMQQPQSNNSIGHGISSYFDNNGYHNNMYNNSYGQVGYSQPNYGQHQQPYPQPQPPRMVDRFSQHMSVPVARQPVPDFQRQLNQNVVQGPPNVELVPKVQIKKEPEEYPEMVTSNFTSLFTTSLMSLVETDDENEFAEGNNSGDISNLSLPHLSPVVPPVEDPPASFQRLHTSGGHFTNTSGEYQGERNNFGFFENRMQNCIPPSSDVQEIGSKGVKINSFRYDRPSFDDFSLYASNSTTSKPPTSHKRKNNLPNISHENHATENRKKAPLATPYKNESQWTPPNSFEFGVISIKQEPLDDYNSNELDAQISCKESPPGSNGNSIRVKTPEQQKEHSSKQPVRKRSPGSTCFDRFDKKSTPTAKKVSPLSVYAKVQESVVLNVKCRRYKKRTKPITIKEEPVSPDREEMENYKRSSLTPDQAARCVVSDLVERVSLFGERNVVGDLSHMDPRQLRDRLLQFCQRSNLDYRDFEDASCILRPRIVMDTKNSVRASAIRKRTSTSPVEVQPPPAQNQVVKTRRRGRKKADLKESPPVEKRVLRQLPGRARGRPRSQTPVDIKQDSTEKSREGEDEEKKVAEVIDLLNDSEDEASKVAEVQKKSQRGKRKRASAAKATAVSSGSLEEDKSSKAVSIDKSTKKTKSEAVEKVLIKEERVKPVGRRRKREVSLEDVTNLVENEVPEVGDELRRRTRSRGRRVVIPEEIPKPPPRKRRSCTQRKTNYDFEPEVEIVNIIRRRHSRSPPMLNAIKLDPPSLKTANKTKPKRARKKRRTKSKKVKTESPILKPVEISKLDDDIEIEPPVLHNSVAETETRDALKMEPPLLESAEPIKRKNSNKAKLPSFEAPEIKAENEIEMDPLLTAQVVQKAGKENTHSVVETTLLSKSKKDDKKPILSTNNKFLKNTIEPTSTNSVVKSGSSKRKQEGPIKYLKENSKMSTPQTILELNSNNKNLMSDVMNGLSYSTSNLVPNFNVANFMKVDTLSAIVPASDNSPESLKERYRKSFCVESLPLPNTPWRHPKESAEKSFKANLLQKSNNSAITLKSSFETSQHLNQSLAKENDDFATKLKINNSDKTFYNLLKNIKAPCDISSTLIAKVKEEPLSDDDIPYNFSHVAASAKFSTTKTSRDIKTESKLAKSATTPKAKSDIKTVKKLPKSAPTSKDNKDTKPGKKPVKHATTSKDNGDFKTEKKPPLRRLSIPNRRRSSQGSESELQVVLTLLPDAQVDLQNGSVTDELVRKCEKEQERMEAVIKEEVLSEYDSDEDKPLACFQTKRTQYSGSNNNLRPDSSPPDKKGALGTWEVDNFKKPRSVNHSQSSDSEDSDCGLVIDLDRRLSVEEQVPSPTPTDKDTKEAEKASQDAPFEGTAISVKQENTPLQDSHSTKVKEEPFPSTSRDTFYHDATEEAHILLELSRSGMRSLNEETAVPSTSTWIPPTVNSSEASGDAQAENGSEEKGSILRTLLLENGDATPGQDIIGNPGSSTSNEHQSSLSQEAERNLLRRANLFPFLANRDGRNLFDPTQFSPDQFPPDINNLDLENCEWTCWDLEEIQAEIQKVRNEIKGLSKMADGKDRERASIMCYMKYKEEVLKRLLKRYSAKLKNQEKDSIQENSEKETESKGHSSSASTSTTNGEYTQVSEELSYRLTVRTERPSATVTSSDSLASNSVENLPPVATMVASATENYGVDLRTVTSRQENVGSIPTILHEALSSKEPIYRPVATRSPLRRHERADESSQMVQKKSLATQDCSFIPNLPSNSELPLRSQRSSRHYSRRRFRRSPPSLNPEFNQSSSFTPVTQPHVRTPSETAPSHHVSSISSHNGTIPSISSVSSPKSSSTTTNNRHRIILRTEPGSPLNINSIDLSTNHMFSSRFTSYRRTNGHSSNRSTIIEENDYSSNRSATIVPINDHSSDLSTSIDLTNGHSYNRSFVNELNNDHSSNRSAYIELTNGHSSSRSASSRLTNSDSSSRSASIVPSSYSSSTIGLDHLSNRSNSIQLTNGHSSNRSASIELTNSHSFNRSGSIALNNDNPSNRSASIDLTNGHSSNRSASIDLTNGNLSNRSASIVLTNGYSSNRSASIELLNGYSSNRLASIDLANSHSSNESASSGLTHGHSSSTFGITSDHSSFMIVPPPTTLQSSFGPRGLHASMPEAQSERAMDIKVEDTHELENEEGPQSYFTHASSTSFVPYAGPLMAIAPTLDHRPRCKGCGNARPNFVCSGCKSHWYCSTECQNLRWAEHSRTCLRDHLKENSTSYK